MARHGPGVGRSHLGFWGKEERGNRSRITPDFFSRSKSFCGPWGVNKGRWRKWYANWKKKKKTKNSAANALANTAFSSLSLRRWGRKHFCWIWVELTFLLHVPPPPQRKKNLKNKTKQKMCLVTDMESWAFFLLCHKESRYCYFVECVARCYASLKRSPSISTLHFIYSFQLCLCELDTWDCSLHIQV